MQKSFETEYFYDRDALARRAPITHALEELRPEFLQYVAQQLAEARRQIACDDYHNLALLGHRLRGSGLMYGIPTISKIGERLERAAQQTRLAVITNLLNSLGRVLRIHQDPSLPSVAVGVSRAA